MFQPQAFDFRGYLRELVGFKFARAAALRSSYLRTHLLSARVAGRLRRAQRFKPVSVIVHTRRDLAQMKFVHGMRDIYDHPLGVSKQRRCRRHSPQRLAQQVYRPRPGPEGRQADRRVRHCSGDTRGSIRSSGHCTTCPGIIIC